MSMENPPSTNDAFVAGAKVGGGRFTLVRRLGSGGMGVVWLARDERLGEEVALKFLPPEIASDPVALADMRHETLKSRKLSHPNIVRIHDLHEPAGEPAFISMEFVEGTTLSALKAEQPHRLFSWEQLRPFVRQLCDALDYAHWEGVIHRDLKPANVMLDARGRLKLADFGLAALEAEHQPGAADNPGLSGTPSYMSPQQGDGQIPRETDDIYALGALLYELLTSKPPFHEGDILLQVKHDAAEPLARRLARFGLANDIPAKVNATVMACLAKDPAHRPPSIQAVSAHLESQAEAGPPVTVSNLVEPPAAPTGPDDSSHQAAVQTIDAFQQAARQAVTSAEVAALQAALRRAGQGPLAGTKTMQEMRSLLAVTMSRIHFLETFHSAAQSARSAADRSALETRFKRNLPLLENHREARLELQQLLVEVQRRVDELSNRRAAVVPSEATQAAAALPAAVRPPRKVQAVVPVEVQVLNVTPRPGAKLLKWGGAICALLAATLGGVWWGTKRVEPRAEKTVAKQTGVAANQSLFLPDGLVAYFPFNGHASDVSGSGIAGTANLASLTTNRHGAANAAYSFPGNGKVDAYIDLGRPASLQFSGDFTVSAWVLMSGGETNPRIVSNGQDAGYELLTAWTGTTRRFESWYAGQRLASDSFYPENQWHFVALQRKGSTLELFINGRTDGNLLITNAPAYNHNCQIGKKAGWLDRWGGIIDEVRFYNRALSADELTRLYEFEGVPDPAKPATATAPSTPAPAAKPAAPARMKPTGTTLFQPPQPLLAGGAPINLGSHAAPRLVDWNGDGVLDLLVGAGDGTARIFMAAWPTNSASFRPGTLVQAGGITLRADKGYTGVCFVDMTGDGRPDLVIAGDDNRVRLCRNTGTASQPVFASPMLIQGTAGEFVLPNDCRGRIDVADWDGDGLPDLFTGDLLGFLTFFKNTGTAATPRYGSPGVRVSFQGKVFQESYNTHPRVLDLNQDGVLALCYGVNWSYFQVLINHAGPGSLNFTQKTPFTYANRAPVGIRQLTGDDTIPDFGDLNGDGVLDLITGSFNGRVFVLYGVRPGPGGK